MLVLRGPILWLILALSLTSRSDAQITSPLGSPEGVSVFFESGGLLGPSELRAERFFAGRSTGLRGTGVEFTFKVQPEKPEAAKGWEFEVGLGYEY